MAKDRFYRSKPHVNVGLLPELEKLGFTSVGRHQLLFAQPVTDPADLRLLASLVETHNAASGLPTGKRQHKPVTIAKPVDKGELLLSLLTGSGRQRSGLGGKGKSWISGNFEVGNTTQLP